MSALLERFDSKKPKKILSLDGGGIRGALTLGYLKKIEDILKAKHNNDPSFRLSDYFDLIGGTSTGAIIASLLALGKTVDEIKSLYMDLGNKIFGRKLNWWDPLETYKWLKANYDYRGMMEGLKFALGADTTLESDKIKTGLCIVCKRADTNSIWPIINHPRGKYFDSPTSKNKDLKLWQVVRASTAAPTYFAPQMIDVKDNQVAAFIDGGLSMANNPSLTLLMVATLKGFPFQWQMGEDKLLLVSAGTGFPEYKKQVGDIDNATILTWASNIPDMLMQDASWQNRLLLQWLSNSPTAEKLDSEIGTLDGDYIGGNPLMTYLRYNFAINEKNLNALGMKMKFTEKDVLSIADMAQAKNKELLFDIGYAASTAILPSHFEKF